MTAFDDAIVSVLLADYIATDANGKMNALGGGFQAIPVQANGASNPFYVCGIVEVPHRHVGSQIPITLELIDVTEGGSFRIRTPNGELQAVRAEQMWSPPPGTLAVPSYQPVNDANLRLQMVMGFPNGLPLTPGHRFEWRVRVEGRYRKGWVAPFHVLAPVPPPVLGGVGGPSDIPNVPPIDGPVDDDEGRS